jgi:sorbitol-specific phosphotransferase system component IIBC
MRTLDLSIPELAFIAATRGMAGVGIGLLLADHVRPEARKPMALMLLAIGALTTLPIAATVVGRTRPRLIEH